MPAGGGVMWLCCCDIEYVSLAYYNSSGVLQWRKAASGKAKATTAAQAGNAGDISSPDSSGRVWVSVDTDSDGSTGHFFKLFDTSGSVVATVDVSSLSYAGGRPGIEADSSGNVYSMFIDTVDSTLDLKKWNSSGTLQWTAEDVWDNFATGDDYMSNNTCDLNAGGGLDSMTRPFQSKLVTDISGSIIIGCAGQDFGEPPKGDAPPVAFEFDTSGNYVRTYSCTAASCGNIYFSDPRNWGFTPFSDGSFIFGPHVFGTDKLFGSDSGEEFAWGKSDTSDIDWQEICSAPASTTSAWMPLLDSTDSEYQITEVAASDGSTSNTFTVGSSSSAETIVWFDADSSNVYTLQGHPPTSSGNVRKFNSSGTEQWDTEFGVDTGTTTGGDNTMQNVRRIVHDGSGGCYVTAIATSTSGW